MASHTQNGVGGIGTDLLAGQLATGVTGGETSVPQDLAVEIVDVSATITPTLASTPVTILTDAKVGSRRRVRAVYHVAVRVNGATAVTAADAAWRLRVTESGSSALARAHWHVPTSALTASALVGPGSGNYQVLSVVAPGGALGKGLAIVGSATDTATNATAGSDLNVRVIALIGP